MMGKGYKSIEKHCPYCGGSGNIGAGFPLSIIGCGYCGGTGRITEYAPLPDQAPESDTTRTQSESPPE